MEATIRTLVAIAVNVSRGEGTPESPCRSVVLYFNEEGTLLAEDDPCLPIAYNFQKQQYQRKSGGIVLTPFMEELKGEHER